MNREKLSERFLRIYFNNVDILVDVNNINSDIWEKILNKKDKIIKVETSEWVWNLLTGDVVIFH
jgi:predicted O-linked N-acetylglucosamine transferase (SPINDLY family)